MRKLKVEIDRNKKTTIKVMYNPFEDSITFDAKYVSRLNDIDRARSCPAHKDGKYILSGFSTSSLGINLAGKVLDDIRTGKDFKKMTGSASSSEVIDVARIVGKAASRIRRDFGTKFQETMLSVFFRQAYSHTSMPSTADHHLFQVFRELTPMRASGYMMVRDFQQFQANPDMIPDAHYWDSQGLTLRDVFLEACRNQQFKPEALSPVHVSHLPPEHPLAPFGKVLHMLYQVYDMREKGALLAAVHEYLAKAGLPDILLFRDVLAVSESFRAALGLTTENIDAAILAAGGGEQAVSAEMPTVTTEDIPVILSEEQEAQADAILQGIRETFAQATKSPGALWKADRDVLENLLGMTGQSPEKCEALINLAERLNVPDVRLCLFSQTLSGLKGYAKAPGSSFSSAASRSMPEGLTASEQKKAVEWLLGVLEQYSRIEDECVQQLETLTDPMVKSAILQRMKHWIRAMGMHVDAENAMMRLVLKRVASGFDSDLQSTEDFSLSDRSGLSISSPSRSATPGMEDVVRWKAHLYPAPVKPMEPGPLKFTVNGLIPEALDDQSTLFRATVAHRTNYFIDIQKQLLADQLKFPFYVSSDIFFQIIGIEDKIEGYEITQQLVHAIDELFDDYINPVCMKMLRDGTLTPESGSELHAGLRKTVIELLTGDFNQDRKELLMRISVLTSPDLIKHIPDLSETLKGAFEAVGRRLSSNAHAKSLIVRCCQLLDRRLEVYLENRDRAEKCKKMMLTGAAAEVNGFLSVRNMIANALGQSFAGHPAVSQIHGVVKSAIWDSLEACVKQLGINEYLTSREGKIILRRSQTRKTDPAGLVYLGASLYQSLEARLVPFLQGMAPLLQGMGDGEKSLPKKMEGQIRKHVQYVVDAYLHDALGDMLHHVQPPVVEPFADPRETFQGLLLPESPAGILRQLYDLADARGRSQSSSDAPMPRAEEMIPEHRQMLHQMFILVNDRRGEFGRRDPQLTRMVRNWIMEKYLGLRSDTVEAGYADSGASSSVSPRQAYGFFDASTPHYAGEDAATVPNRTCSDSETPTM